MFKIGQKIVCRQVNKTARLTLSILFGLGHADLILVLATLVPVPSWSCSNSKTNFDHH